MALPPGQQALGRFPRYGTHFRDPPPAVPAAPVLVVDGMGTLPLPLAGLPRREVVADFHCVAGWSSTGLRWEGVPLDAVLPADDTITHVRFHCLDGYSAAASVEDLRADDVLLADTLDGEPLNAKHGAPLRLVSPQQYGFVSAKHVCRIEPLTREPFLGFSAASPVAAAFLGGFGFARFTRGRVWEQERHRYLPAWFVQRAVVPLVRRPRPRPPG